jgi:hypothetical protein
MEAIMEATLTAHEAFLREVAEWRVYYLDLLRDGMETLALRQKTREDIFAKRVAALEACRIYSAAY